MRKAAVWAAVAAVVLGGGASAYKLANAGGDVASLFDPNRPDCPGQIVCPLTGDLVCRDQCPLGDASALENEALSCCQGKK
jgi:hypothetical protein